MSIYEEAMRDSLDRISTDGKPDREKMQRELTEQFVGTLLLCGDDSPDAVCEQFARQYTGVLRWLGKDRQDEILRAGMREAGVDLSHWLTKEEER